MLSVIRAALLQINVLRNYELLERIASFIMMCGRRFDTPVRYHIHTQMQET